MTSIFVSSNIGELQYLWMKHNEYKTFYEYDIQSNEINQAIELNLTNNVIKHQNCIKKMTRM